MEVFSGVALWVKSRRKNRREDTKVSQEIMRSTIDQLHIELHELREEYKQYKDDIQAEVLELSRALAECDRERVRLMIEQEHKHGSSSITVGDDQSSSSQRSEPEIQQGTGEPRRPTEPSEDQL